MAEGQTPPQIGTQVEDGTIYAGRTKAVDDKGSRYDLYVAPADAPLTLSFNDAAAYAAAYTLNGKKDFSVPTREELAIILKSQGEGALKGTFDTSNDAKSAWYWTSKHSYPTNNAWCFRASDRLASTDTDSHESSVRFVRRVLVPGG